MSKDEIIEMAVKAGNSYLFDAMQTDFLQRFAALVAEKERGACAQICEELVPDMSRTANDASIWDVATFDCADAIRARKP